MAFEEITEPRNSYNPPKQVYASFDSDSSPAGITTHRPSASLLKDTPPSIIVALAKLSPIISMLNTALSLLTWTSDNNWSSFLVLLMWWLVCLYGQAVFRYAGNWIVLLTLGFGYYRKKLKTRLHMRAIQKGEDPSKIATEDTQAVMDRTLYEIDCFSARCELLGAAFEPLYTLYTWEDPKRSALIGMRLVLTTPFYLVTLWMFSTRSLVMITGTIVLICTSSWFRVICTVSWRFQIIRKIVWAFTGVSYFPGESGLMSSLSRTPTVGSTIDSAKSEADASGSRFTTVIAVIENQRRWLGLGWTPSLLPHERAPFTDVENTTCPSPDHYGLPASKTIVENGTNRTTSWKWIDTEWRIEKDRGRDPDGWLYFDNSWHHPTPTEEYGKYTRRRKWIRNAECSEKVELSSKAISTQIDKPSDRKVLTIDPEKVRFSGDTKTTEPIDKIASVESPKREWRTIEGGGRELVPIIETSRKRPLAFRRKSSKSSIRSVGQQSVD